jgi:hypothetical protein
MPGKIPDSTREMKEGIEWYFSDRYSMTYAQ